MWRHKTSIIYNEVEYKNVKDVYMFDLDGTLVKNISGRPFPKKDEGWRYFSKEVIPTLKRMVSEGKTIVIVTNQNGILKGRVSARSVELKCEKIMEDVGCEIKVCMALKKNSGWRKPNTRIFDRVKEKNFNDLPLENCHYVGDAAGRLGDFSDSDKMFAKNCGISFSTPDEFFLDSKVTKIIEQELVMLVGPAASGKSTFTDKHFGDYVRINNDTMKSISKRKKLAMSSLQEGKSVIIDNTNGKRKNRSLYLDMAKGLNIKVRCFWLDRSPELCKKMNVHRSETQGVKKLPNIVYNCWFAKFEPPDEIEDVKTIPFTY